MNTFSLGHERKLRIRPQLVHPALFVPRPLASTVDHKKNLQQRKRSQRTDFPSPSRTIRISTNGSLCHIHQPLALRFWRLANNTLANLLCGNPVRVSTTQMHRTITKIKPPRDQETKLPAICRGTCLRMVSRAFSEMKSNHHNVNDVHVSVTVDVSGLIPVRVARN